jgi:tetratricopeptide (TPR) repeat protein
MMRLISKYICVITLVILMTGLVSAEEIFGALEDGEKAFLLGEYDKAEKIYSAFLEKEPDNFILLRAQANTKIKLKKFIEAERLLNRILSMPSSTGRDIRVHAEADVLEAELVDETVMAVDASEKSDDAFSQFLKKDHEGPVPHYRVFLKKTGR